MLAIMRKREYIDWASLLITITFLFLCFINHDNYEKAIPYASLGAFASLGLLFFNKIPFLSLLKKKDKELWLMIVADGLAFFNLLYVNSGLGAFFTIGNLLLLLYMADKVEMTEAQMRTFCAIGVFFFLLWTLEIKWDYGSNQTGLVILTMLILTVLYLDMLKEKYKCFILFPAQVLAMVFGYVWIVWLRARCAWVGLLVFAVLFFVPRGIFKKKGLYKLLLLFSTIGAILFAAAYIVMSGLGVDFYMPFMYKRFLSGRELIWFELAGAYLRNSLTGIGSSYEMKVYYMEGGLEVHNGLLDILIIHGTVCFCLVIYFLWRRLRGIREAASQNKLAKTAMAGIFSMLVASFFENYFIVAPYSMIFFYLFLIINWKRGTMNNE